MEMVTTNPAAALGVAGYGLRVGGPADLVVFDAPSAADALRLVAPRYLVLRAWLGRGPHDAGPHRAGAGRRRGAGDVPAAGVRTPAAVNGG